MKVISLKDSLQWWRQFLMTLCYKDSMNCQFIILEVRVLTAINNSVFPQMISCQGTSGDQSIGLSNVMQRHFFSHFRSYYVWCHGDSLKGELVFDCSRNHLELGVRGMKMMFHNRTYAHRWPKLIKYQLQHHYTAYLVVNLVNFYPILLLDRLYIYNFPWTILSNFTNSNGSD